MSQPLQMDDVLINMWVPVIRFEMYKISFWLICCLILYAHDLRGGCMSWRWHCHRCPSTFVLHWNRISGALARQSEFSLTYWGRLEECSFQWPVPS
jgi:hypothetical protein